MVRGRVLIDMCTQRDFLCEKAPYEVGNREQLIKHLKRVVAWARLRRIPVVSAVDAHRPQEPSNGEPRHCIDGTDGQQKLPFTLLTSRTTLEADNSFAVPMNVFRKHRQVVLRKRTNDLLCNPKADRLLSESRVGEYVVFGVGVENGIKALVLGLLARGKRVTVVADACGYWDRTAAEMALRQMEAKGAQLIRTDDLQTLPRARYPSSRWLARRAAASRPGTNGNGHERSATTRRTKGADARGKPGLGLRRPDDVRTTTHPRTERPC